MPCVQAWLFSHSVTRSEDGARVTWGRGTQKPGGCLGNLIQTWEGLRSRPSSGGEGREGRGAHLVPPASMGIVTGDRIEPKWRAVEGRGWGPQRPGDANYKHGKCKEDPCAPVIALLGFLCMQTSANRHPLFTFLPKVCRGEMAAPMPDSTADQAERGHTRAMLLGDANANPVPWIHIYRELTTLLMEALGIKGPSSLIPSQNSCLPPFTNIISGELSSYIQPHWGLFKQNPNVSFALGDLPPP